MYYIYLFQPCFEPRSTIRPTLLDSKPGKEEKKNLIGNMEYPEDYWIVYIQVSERAFDEMKY